MNTMNFNGKTYIQQLKLVYCITALMAFFCGISIYAFFRNLNIILFQFFPKPFFLDVLHCSIRSNSLLKSMFLYNLPDGLWFLSGLLLIRAVWLTNKKWWVFYCGIFILIALLMEISQLIETVPGTFDLLDIVFFIFFTFMENLIFNLRIKRGVTG